MKLQIDNHNCWRKALENEWFKSAEIACEKNLSFGA